VKAFRIYDRVRTPHGIGTVQSYDAVSDRIVVMIGRTEFKGERPAPYTESSPSITMRFEREELEYA